MKKASGIGTKNSENSDDKEMLPGALEWTAHEDGRLVVVYQDDPSRMPADRLRALVGRIANEAREVDEHIRSPFIKRMCTASSKMVLISSSSHKPLESDRPARATFGKEGGK